MSFLRFLPLAGLLLPLLASASPAAAGFRPRQPRKNSAPDLAGLRSDLRAIRTGQTTPLRGSDANTLRRNLGAQRLGASSTLTLSPPQGRSRRAVLEAEVSQRSTRQTVRVRADITTGDGGRTIEINSVSFDGRASAAEAGVRSALTRRLLHKLAETGSFASATGIVVRHASGERSYMIARGRDATTVIETEGGRRRSNPRTHSAPEAGSRHGAGAEAPRRATEITTSSSLSLGAQQAGQRRAVLSAVVRQGETGHAVRVEARVTTRDRGRTIHVADMEYPAGSAAGDPDVRGAVSRALLQKLAESHPLATRVVVRRPLGFGADSFQITRGAGSTTLVRTP